MTRLRDGKGRLRIPLAMAAAAVVAAGCSAGAGTAQASSKSAGSTSKAVKAAQKELDKYKGVPKFVRPNAPFKASSLKGKTVALIGINLTTPALTFAIQGAEKAAKAVGINTTVFDGKNEPSLWTEGIQQAISAHDGAIALFGVPVGAVGSQLQAAKAAGIPVVNVENNEPSTSAPGQGAGSDIYASASEDMNLEGRLAADAAIVQTKGHAKAIIMNTPGLTPGPPIVSGFKSVLRSCSGCSVVTQTTIQIQTWATGLGPQTTSTLRANPSANVILPIFDTMALFIVPAVQAANDSGKVTVQSTSGFPAATAMMLKYPKVLTGLAGQSDYWSGWLAMNQAMRGMLKLKPGNPVVPTRYVTPAVAKKHGTSEAALYGNSYEKGFKKLWGVG